VRALAEWLHISGIEEGYLFRKIYAGDRLADLDRNVPMVGQYSVETELGAHCEYHRPQSSFWNCSATTFLTSRLITTLMELTHSDGEAASFLLLIVDGL
jgi:hypothetical protein